MNWWDIVKIKLPEDHDERMAREEIQRIYGFSPYRLGSLKALNDLRGDYSNINNLTPNYEFKKDLKMYLTIYDRAGYRGGKHFLIYGIVLNMIYNDGSGKNRRRQFSITENKDEKEIKKYFMDWVEIYDKPNHTYKNIAAVEDLSPRSKELLSKYKPVNDIENILIREPKIVSGRVEDDIWEFELPPKNSHMDETNVDRAAIIQLSRSLK